MDGLSSRQYLLWGGFLVGAVVAFQMLILVNTQLALLLGVVVCVAPLIVYLAARDVSSLTLLVILILPFHGAPILSENLAGVQGMKPFNLLAAMAIAAALLSGGFFKLRDRTDKLVLAGFAGFFVVWTLTFLRSVPNSLDFHYLNPITFQRSTADYLLSFYVKPSLSLMLFYVVYRLARSPEAIERFVRALCLSMLLLSVVIVLTIVTDPGAVRAGRDTLNLVFERHLGLHYNTIGTMYLLIGPLLLWMAIQRRGLWTVNYAIAGVILAVIGSRTALVVFVLSSLAALVVVGRLRLALIGLLVAALSFWALAASPTLSALLSVGVQSGQIVSIDLLLEQRQTALWAPVLLEWTEDPVKFWFGAGLFGILTSDVARLGFDHAHNGLIDFFLNCGVILTGGLMLFIAWGFVRAWRVGRRVGDPLFWALAVCVLAYLISTLTGRGFFPRYDNGQLFPILALLIALGRVRLAGLKTPRNEHAPYRKPALGQIGAR